MLHTITEETLDFPVQEINLISHANSKTGVKKSVHLVICPSTLEAFYRVTHNGSVVYRGANKTKAVKEYNKSY